VQTLQKDGEKGRLVGKTNELIQGNRCIVPLHKKNREGRIPAGIVSEFCVLRRAGRGANHHLRQSLVYVNVLAMAQPEAYVAGG
jgi:hypothetical protein